MQTTRRPSTTVERLAAALEEIAIGAVGLTTRALAHGAPGVDLTFPQWRVLLLLGGDLAGSRVGEVAARVGVTLPATGRLLRRLERRGFVALTTDPADRRATRATLTELGCRTRAAILAFRREALEQIAAEVAGAAGAAGAAGDGVEPTAGEIAAAFRPFG